MLYKSAVTYSLLTDLFTMPILNDFGTNIQIEIHQGVMDQNQDWTGFFERVPSFTLSKLFYQVDEKPNKMIYSRDDES